ncbi:MAG: ATP-grasp domain-containing protein [Pseudobdellovibrio sp.]
MKKLKIVLLFDIAIKMDPKEYRGYWSTPDWKTENDVRKALVRLGHQVIPFGLYDDLEPFIKIVRDEKPDLVFNMSEAFSGQRKLEPHITALMEMLGVPFTGAGAKCLQLCKDKGLTKVILDYHDIKTPQFIVFQKGKSISTKALGKFPFPGFVKPLQLESSEGISQQSYVVNAKEAIARVQFIQERYQSDVIIEEFIDGREVYVSILGNEKLNVFPVRELFFKQMPDHEPKFATYQSKWNQNYRKKWGIDSDWAKNLSEPMQKKLDETCKKIYKLLQIQGFGRIDLRIRNDEIYFIEANPNPSIAAKEDYALSAHKAGVEYEDLIAKIVSLSLSA